MKRELRRFQVADETGRRYTAVEYQHSIADPSFEEPDARLETLRELRTTTGRPVNRISDQEYEILLTVGDPIRVRKLP